MAGSVKLFQGNGIGERGGDVPIEAFRVCGVRPGLVKDFLVVVVGK